MFIDASKEYKTSKLQNELTDENIQKIVNAYRERIDIDHYAHVAKIDEIIENGWNLNIPRYVDTAEEEEEIDLAVVKSKLEAITLKKQSAIEKVDKVMKLLGL